MRWIPVISFLPNRLKDFFNYSYKLLLSNLVEVGYTNIFPLLIGKSYNSSQLGYYNNGRQLPSLAANTINASIASVTFSIYSRYQYNSEKLKFMVRRSVVTSNFIILPFMAFLASSAEPLVLLILTEKWLPSVIYLQLFCIALGLHHQHNIGFQAISAIGRSDVFLKYQLIKKGLGIFVLLVTLKFGLVTIVIGQVLVAFISIFISLFPFQKYLNYSISEQLKDFYLYLILSLIMFACSYPIIYLEMNPIQIIIFQLIVVIVLYLSLAFSFGLDGLKYSYKIFRKYIFNSLKKRKVAMKNINDKAVFTVCNVAYLDKAMVLAHSLYEHTNIKIDIFIFDKKEPSIFKNDVCNFHWIEDLEVPEFKYLSFKYTVIELTTALKPWLALNLLKENSKVIFLDPDVMIFNNFDVIFNDLELHPVVLTPHYHLPKINNLIDDEQLLRFGVYNLGFFAVNSSNQGKSF